MKKNNFFIIAMCVASLSAYAGAPTGYYSAVDNKSGADAILTALFGIVGPHTTVSYDALYELYETSDNTADGKVWDMYSTCTFEHNKNKCGSYSKVCQCYNREHSIPQSWFDKAKPMVSDAFHVVPTDGYVNNQRGNFPFGECANGTRLDSRSLGKLGTSTFSGFSGKVFEPDDQYKGDFARSYFYMVACYYDRDFTQSPEGEKVFTYGKKAGLTSYAVSLFLKWHRQDPVSQKELDRNEAIYAAQKNRNPFIDYPCLAEYIWGDKQGQAINLAELENCRTSDPTDPTDPQDPQDPKENKFHLLPVSDVHENSAVLHWTDAKLNSYTVDVYTKSTEGEGEEQVDLLEDDFADGSKHKTDGYTAYNEKDGEGNCIRLGSGSKTGSITYSGLDLTAGGKVYFTAKQYGNDQTTVIVTVGSQKQEFTLTASYAEYQMDFSATDETTVVISTAESKKRAYINHVKIVSGGEVVVKTSVEGYPMAVGEVLEHRVTGLEPFQLYYFTVTPDGAEAEEGVFFTEEGWTGTHFVEFTSTDCYVANGNIVIEGLEHNALLQVFAANGQLLLSRVSDGSDMQLSMPRGLYLVHISKQNRVKTYKVSL